MKRFTSFALASTLIFAGLLAGCGKTEAPAAPTPTTPPPAPTVEPATTAPAAPATTPTGEMKTVEPAATAATGTAPAAGKAVYELSPDTTITWAATVPIGTRTGGWTDFKGTVEIENGTFETAKIAAEVQMKSVFADANEIKEKMLGKEHFFNPIDFPTSSFKSTGVKKTDKGYDVTGDLTVRDKTKSITLPVTDVKIEGKTLTCKATVKLNRHDFGIEYNSAIGDYAINDMCDLVLDVIAETK
ncbi:MAG: YceI family protein [Candidatus Hydrogenedentes bacterium]|nr:YceI family protein [Candidatus Hydrogenedentota bacterium]